LDRHGILLRHLDILNRRQNIRILILMIFLFLFVFFHFQAYFYLRAEKGSLHGKPELERELVKSLQLWRLHAYAHCLNFVALAVAYLGAIILEEHVFSVVSLVQKGLIFPVILPFIQNCHLECFRFIGFHQDVTFGSLHQLRLIIILFNFFSLTVLLRNIILF
jgi:hypothetical protein